MRQYIIRRVLQMIPVLFGISVILYGLFSMAPGDAISNILENNPKISAERIAQLRHLYHLDEPILVQYGYWLKDAIQGNLGESFKHKMPVSQVINSYIWNSFYLTSLALLAAVLLAVPIGVLSATRQYSRFDYGFTVFALMGISMPTFFMGMLLVKWLAIDIQLFPVAGMQSTGSTLTGLAHIGDVFYHLFLPFLVLTFMNMATFMRYTRTSMLEVIRQDYIRTARAKGLSEKVVIYKHALRNALIPVITLLGVYLPALFSGAMITETVFAWPGIGPVAIQAVGMRDYPVLMGINVFLAFLTLVGNLLADVMYAMVDPRIRYK